jgi:hypothetical protein
MKIFFSLLASVALFTACGDGSSSGGEGGKPQGNLPIEIQGTWTSNFGGEETISNTSWSSAYDAETVVASKVVYYNNTTNTAVVQSAEDASFFANTFSKHVWTEISDNSVYYCIVAYAKSTQEEALQAAETADATSPETSGCGGFPWTKLTRQ